MTLDPESDQQHRPLFRRLAIAAGLLGCVAIGLIFPFPLEGRLWGELFDLAHAPVFCASLLLIVGLCDPSAIGFSKQNQVLLPMNLRRVFGIAGLLIAIGSVAELLQELVGRNASVADIGANAVGLMAGICWVARCQSQPLESGRKYTLVAFLLLVLVSVHPILQTWDCFLQIRSFPMLASFERPRELGNWQNHAAVLSRSNEWATDGTHCAKLKLRKANYPGMLMTWFEHDWSGRSRLLLDLKNPGEIDLQIVLKLHDAKHVDNGFADDDRFHEVTVVPAGQEVSLNIPLSKVRNAPVSRQMELEQMWMIDIFAVQLQQPAVLLVDSLRLE